MRNQFDNQLEMLNVELIKMGALCEEAIASAIVALLDYDINGYPESDVTRNNIHNKKALIDKVLEIENEINQSERDIESLCLKLILKQQPVANDLRVVSSALKMISDMERIGDQAADIAEMTKGLHINGVMSKVDIKGMAKAAIKMVTDSVDSFVKNDLDLAYQVIAHDDIVDNYFDLVKNDLIVLIGDNASNGRKAIDLLMIAKYLERIGDHAVNIAEWVIYSITGEHKGIIVV